MLFLTKSPIFISVLFFKTENLIKNKNLLHKMSIESYIKYQNLYINSPIENWDMILKNSK